MIPRRSLLAIVVMLSATAPTVRGQQPPRFQSSVELTSIDVTVVDDRGRPVLDLQPADFTVRVDRMPRRVVSAEWVSLKAPAGRTPAPPPEGYSSNENATGGRLILIVVDQPNLPFAGGARIASAVGTFLDHLEPSDRVAAVALGQGGMATPFTGDRERIKQAVSRMSGRAGRLRATSLVNIGVSEALDIVRGSPMTLDRVVRRECEGLVGEQTDNCVSEVAAVASQLAREAEIDGEETIRSLRSLLEGLKAIDVPKTVLFVSGGFLVRDHAPVAELGMLAAAARSSVYVIKLDETAGDAADAGGGSFASSFDDRLARGEGLEVLAAASRGSVFTVNGSAAPVFEHIEAELSGYYLLGLESDARDRDGRAHPVAVQVARRGAFVRSRQQIAAIGDEKVVKSPREAMLEALSSPLLVPALPIRVATFALQGPESTKIQLLIHADVGTDYANAKAVALAYVIADSSGRIVDSHVSDARLPPVMTGVPSPLQYTGGASLDPGEYTLKLSVAEGDRVGTVEHVVHAQLVGTGPTRLSELMVGGPFSPTVLLRPTIGTRVSFGTVQGYVEAYGPGAGRVSVQYEVAATPDGETLLASEAEPHPAGSTRTIFTASMPIRQLPAGQYYLRAVVSGSDDQPKTLARSFEVAAPAVLMTSAEGTGAAVTVPGDLYLPVADEMLARPFVREQASRADTVRSFRGIVAPSGQEAFDRGVQLLAQGDYPRAEETFKSVLDTSADSTAALVYLAATFASSGHDLEAAGAWQTSLIDGSNFPEIYEWLSGALLRSRQLSEARAVLEEATAKWPSDVRFALPLSLVYATFGQGREAVRLIERYLAAGPDDPAARALGVEWLYRLHAVGAAVHTPREDLALAHAWADAYIRAKGPQSSLVRQWVQAIEADHP